LLPVAITSLSYTSSPKTYGCDCNIIQNYFVLRNEERYSAKHENYTKQIAQLFYLAFKNPLHCRNASRPVNQKSNAQFITTSTI
jgi:hypothetical protein